MTRYLSLIAFLFFVIAGGLLMGALNPPGAWYEALAKPAFNPPSWLFAPVWTVLYVLIAIAGWRAWRRNPAGALMAFWFLQMALNFGWSPVFFTYQLPVFALVVILVLLATILTFITLAWREDRVAAWLFVPYAAWVAFASLLNAGIVWLN